MRSSLGSESVRRARSADNDSELRADIELGQRTSIRSDITEPNEMRKRENARRGRPNFPPGETRYGLAHAIRDTVRAPVPKLFASGALADRFEVTPTGTRLVSRPTRESFSAMPGRDHQDGHFDRLRHVLQTIEETSMTTLHIVEKSIVVGEARSESGGKRRTTRRERGFDNLVMHQRELRERTPRHMKNLLIDRGDPRLDRRAIRHHDRSNRRARNAGETRWQRFSLRRSQDAVEIRHHAVAWGSAPALFAPTRESASDPAIPGRYRRSRS